MARTDAIPITIRVSESTTATERIRNTPTGTMTMIGIAGIVGIVTVLPTQITTDRTTTAPITTVLTITDHITMARIITAPTIKERITRTARLAFTRGGTRIPRAALFHSITVSIRMA